MTRAHIGFLYDSRVHTVTRQFSLYLAVALMVAFGAGCGGPSAVPPKRVPVPTEVVVLGDSTGNAIDEWPGKWCQALAATHTCQAREWDFVKQAFAPAWSNLGGSGPRVRIWNLSQPGANADYPLQEGRLATVTTTNPGVVILNFGHNQTTANVVPAIAHLVDTVRHRWPHARVVVTLQNPVTTNAAADQSERVSELRKWASKEGLPVIDTWSAFGKAGDLSSLLLPDGTHPSAAGTEVWVHAVEKTIH